MSEMKEYWPIGPTHFTAIQWEEGIEHPNIRRLYKGCYVFIAHPEYSDPDEFPLSPGDWIVQHAAFGPPMKFSDAEFKKKFELVDHTPPSELENECFDPRFGIPHVDEPKAQIFVEAERQYPGKLTQSEMQKQLEQMGLNPINKEDVVSSCAELSKLRLSVQALQNDEGNLKLFPHQIEMIKQLTEMQDKVIMNIPLESTRPIKLTVNGETVGLILGLKDVNDIMEKRKPTDGGS